MQVRATNTPQPCGSTVAPPKQSLAGTSALLNKTKMCKFFDKNRCTKGSECTFAHNMDELKEQPDLYRSQLCSDFARKGSCPRGTLCRFAHGARELRAGGRREKAPATARRNKVENAGRPLTEEALIEHQIHMVQQRAEALRRQMQAVQTAGGEATPYSTKEASPDPPASLPSTEEGVGAVLLASESFASTIDGCSASAGAGGSNKKCLTGVFAEPLKVGWPGPGNVDRRSFAPAPSVWGAPAYIELRKGCPAMLRLAAVDL
mmetsp:Transcript_125900/g.246768  ORF Transcript_125900/g.246768 Transcript_125900/m.246768 type:complete len:262 (-) Transcript_125900:214-999(-)